MVDVELLWSIYHVVSGVVTLLMDETLHQLIESLTQYFTGFYTSQVVGRISRINRVIRDVVGFFQVLLLKVFQKSDIICDAGRVYWSDVFHLFVSLQKNLGKEVVFKNLL